ncbi:MAG TPA: efflux RND transporter periplasmic adaptor subunit [Chthonomonadaceae bacterium]|nr:efflux RND transporter periplasmic adaptor subunit [Chthonomonadaceae bacterium]
MMNVRTLNNPRLALLTAAAVVAGGAAVFVVQAHARQERPVSLSATSSASKGSIILVDAFTVQSRTVQMENTLSGEVTPYRIATVSAEVNKRILNRPIEQGDRVAQGALLASLDAEQARVALDQANATLAQATAARRQAESDYARAEVETDAARQQARAQLAVANAGQDQARAQAEAAKANAQKVRNFTRQQELRQAEAALAQAQTDERLARSEYERYASLVEQGAESKQRLDHVQAALDAAVARRQSAEQGVSLAKEGARREDIAAASAQADAAAAQTGLTGAQIEAARAAVRIADTRDTRLATLRRQIDGLRAQEAQAEDAVRQAQITLDKHRILAPFAGRVLATLAESGELVAPGTPVARLGDISRVKVTFSVPESSRPALHLGQSLTLTADAVKGRTFNGQLTTLGFQADPKSRTFPIEVEVANTEEALLPNMVARLQLSVGNATAHLMVPLGAVATDGAQAYVFVLTEGRAARREVTLGAPVGDRVEVLHGIAAGEQIATTPQRLTDGASVRIAR